MKRNISQIPLPYLKADLSNTQTFLRDLDQIFEEGAYAVARGLTLPLKNGQQYWTNIFGTLLAFNMGRFQIQILWTSDQTTTVTLSRMLVTTNGVCEDFIAWCQ